MKAWPVLLALALSACAVQLKAPTSSQSVALGSFRYVLIQDSPDANDVLEGPFLKRGLLTVSEPTPEIMNQLLVAKWGVSGKRDVMGRLQGYVQEVTLTLLNARTLQQVFTCTAEGQGATEADDIRNAISTCLARLK